MAPETKKPWEKPELRSEEVEETLAKPACGFKAPRKGRGSPGPAPTPAFS